MWAVFFFLLLQLGCVVAFVNKAPVIIESPDAVQYVIGAVVGIAVFGIGAVWGLWTHVVELKDAVARMKGASE